MECNPVALRTTKTPWNFGHSECNRVNNRAKRFLKKLSHLVLLGVGDEFSLNEEHSVYWINFV